MNKKIMGYLAVSIAAFILGTLSTLQAGPDVKVEANNNQAIMQKLDKVLANQEEMKMSLKKIFAKIH